MSDDEFDAYVRSPSSRAAPPDLSEEQAAVAYATAVNSGDVGTLEPFLAKDFCYASQSVLTEMVCARTFATYLAQKFAAVSAAGVKLEADVGTIGRRHCAILYQGEGREPVAAVVAKTSNGRILGLDMITAAPDPRLAQGENRFPGRPSMQSTPTASSEKPDA